MQECAVWWNLNRNSGWPPQVRQFVRDWRFLNSQTINSLLTRSGGGVGRNLANILMYDCANVERPCTRRQH